MYFLLQYKITITKRLVFLIYFIANNSKALIFVLKIKKCPYQMIKSPQSHFNSYVFSHGNRSNAHYCYTLMRSILFLLFFRWCSIFIFSILFGISIRCFIILLLTFLFLVFFVFFTLTVFICFVMFRANMKKVLNFQYVASS